MPHIVYLGTIGDDLPTADKDGVAEGHLRDGDGGLAAPGHVGEVVAVPLHRITEYLSKFEYILDIKLLV